MNPSGSGFIIALVDDDPLAIDQLEANLGRYRRRIPQVSTLEIRNIQVMPRTDGQRCDVSQIASDVIAATPNMVILDLSLCREDTRPGKRLSGLEVLETILPKLPGVPILISSRLVDEPSVLDSIREIRRRSPNNNDNVTLFLKREEDWSKVAGGIAAMFPAAPTTHTPVAVPTITPTLNDQRAGLSRFLVEITDHLTAGRGGQR